MMGSGRAEGARGPRTTAAYQTFVQCAQCHREQYEFHAKNAAYARL